MKKLTTIFAVALFGAVLGFACGGSKQSAESTMPEANPCNPCAETMGGDTGGDLDDMGGDTYGGDSYGY